jgi:signal transduction histidine kinase
LVTLTALLETEGYEVEACDTAEKALNYMATEGPLDLVLSDLKLPDGSGLQVLWALKKINRDAAFILTTGHASVETAVEAVNEGAFAYHVKPVDVDALLSSVRNAIKQRRLMVENRSLLEELKHTNEELVGNNLELERVSQAKTQILATVTHELKTPLTSVVGYVDRLLLEQDKVGPLNEKQERYLNRVQTNSRRLQSLIDDLLDISRIESGTLQLALADLEVRQETEEVVRAMRAELDDKQLRLLLNIPSDLPWIRSDRLRFTQIVSNLLSNACKYSPEGATVAISAKVDNGFIQIDIADTGIGISEGDQTQLFTKFFRSDNSSTRRESGTGLGLFITKHIVEATGGDIWVHSREGKGSTFSFTVPRVAGGTTEEQEPSERNALWVPSIAGSGPPSDTVRQGGAEELADGAELWSTRAGSTGREAG